jgi:hypothetical protein
MEGICNMHEGVEKFIEDFVRTHQGKRPVGRYKLTREDIIAIDHRELGREKLNSQISVEHCDELSGSKKFGDLLTH